MLLHNIILVYRNFRRHKGTFVINLAGLSMGIACALMIYLWVEDELSFDKFHEKGSRLFQVMQNLQDAGSIATIEYTPHPLAMALVDEFPEVEYATTAVLSKWFSNKGVLTFDNRHVKGAAQFISKHYFDIFSCDFIYGHKDQMLTGKYNVAISDEMAMNLFNRTDNLIGKSVDWKLVDSGTDFSGTYVIVGIFKKQPANSSASFDLLLNYELFFEKRPSLQSWGNSDPFTYITLREGTDVEQFNYKIAGFLKSKFKDSTGSLFIRKYSDQHLYSEYNNGVQSGGRIEYVKLFSIIAVFLLLVACINFMNLSTAKASRRLKEVGIKKAIGASKRTLILQHLGESLLMSFISLFVAVILVQLLLPAFNVITGKHLVLNFEINLVLSVLSITLFTGFISGSYPAFYISSFSPAAVLKGKFSTSLGELWARKGLVIFQFAISVILMVSVFVVYRQLEYIQTKNLGYDKDNLVYFDISGVRNERVETFLSETEKIPGVVNATTFIHNLAGNHGGYSGLEWDGKDPNKDIDFSNIEVGYDFLEIMGIQLMDGETFSPELASSRQIIFNKIAIERMGLKDPVGKLIKVAGEEKLIVGITENFHFESLHENIKPCFFQVYPSRGNVLIKIEAGKEQRIIDKVQQLYQQFNPDTPFDFKFMDEDYQSLYVSEQRIAVLSRYFGAMAIFISCIGLFGLSSFSAERRSKEIGIRKVLGSSIFNIVILLSSDFTKIVFAAIVIALPISYFIAKQWLDEFAYRISLSWWYFIITGMTALSIAWLTVGVQALKTAHINSAKCLRDE